MKQWILNVSCYLSGVLRGSPVEVENKHRMTGLRRGGGSEVRQRRGGQSENRSSMCGSWDVTQLLFYKGHI